MILARLLWSLIIKRNHVGAGFPRPIASITDLGGENPPLRWIAWLRLIIKDHKSRDNERTPRLFKAGLSSIAAAAAEEVLLDMTRFSSEH